MNRKLKKNKIIAFKLIKIDRNYFSSLMNQEIIVKSKVKTWKHYDSTMATIKWGTLMSFQLYFQFQKKKITENYIK